jgi:DNA-damage-inducible protein J
MRNSAVVHARIDPSVKHDAEKVFSSLGLTPTEAVRLFYTQVMLTKSIPFHLHIPNELTRKTLEESAAGINVHRYDSVEGLFESWND